jgi:selenide,water dikinase
LDYARRQIAPGGLGRNREYVETGGYVRYGDDVEEAHRLILSDPQTSGGLLFALPHAAADALLASCAAVGEPCWPIGEVVAGEGIVVV